MKSEEPVKRRLLRLLVVLAGIVLGQAVLYGPSLVGRKILLPLDILTEPKTYIPRTPELAATSPHNVQLGDLVFTTEPGRRFLGSEIRSGRFPLWNPHQYAGGPNTWSKFSPFVMLGALSASPRVLPWIEVLAALVSGLGVYRFCRRVLRVAFWPAAIAAWCYPLTAFFVFWQGYGVAYPVVWLPWMLLAVRNTLRRGGVAGVGLAGVTCLVLVSGRLDIAAQVLLTSGLYALWCYFDLYRKRWYYRQALGAGVAVLVGWGLGLLLAAPDVLPTLEYVRTGARMARRSAGAEERPPVGLAALPQVVLPKMYGSYELGSFPIFPDRQPVLAESSAATYTGVLATLFLAPLAWCSRRHRSMNIFLVLLGFLALSWCFNVPGLVSLLRLPGLNMLSHNRFVFAASFAILALAAVGLDVLWQGAGRWRCWFWAPAALLAGLCLWCLGRAVFLPEPIETQLEQLILQGNSFPWLHDLEGVRHVQAWFATTNMVAAALCGLGAACWLSLWGRKTWRSWLVPLFGAFLVGDLLLFGYGRAAQCDPALYYPRIPVLEDIRRSAPGRVIGYDCLPANLATICGLHDVLGYDSVDPAQYIDLIAIGCHPASAPAPFALTSGLTPKMTLTGEGDVRFSPVLDMLGLRYVVFRGSPPSDARPAFQGSDYWVLVNSNALARVSIPNRVELVNDAAARLKKLASPAFSPREVAYVESPVHLPSACHGAAEIVEEIPMRIRVSVRMETPGLVVLADLWDKGWQAYLDGKRVPILRTNHAIRGVVVPAGSGTLEFRYEPASFAWGLRLAALSATLLLGWCGIILWRQPQMNTEKS
jgi:hypothetical protein